jgi:hypothetical protein
VSRGKIQENQWHHEQKIYSSRSDSSVESEMIRQFEEKYLITGKKSERIQILMVLPKS